MPVPSSPREATLWAWAWSGAVVGVLLSLLLFPPARWLAPLLLHGSGGRVLLEDARGTLWSGSANLLLSGGLGSQDRTSLPSRVYWELRPAAQGLHASLLLPCCMERPLALALAWLPGALRLSLADSQSHWPASLVSGLGTPWNTVQPQGQLQLASQGLSVEWADGK